MPLRRLSEFLGAICKVPATLSEGAQELLFFGSISKWIFSWTRINDVTLVTMQALCDVKRSRFCQMDFMPFLVRWQCSSAAVCKKPSKTKRKRFMQDSMNAKGVLNLLLPHDIGNTLIFCRRAYRLRLTWSLLL